LKEEALDRAMWRARFGRDLGPVVRQTTKWMMETNVTNILQKYLSCCLPEPEESKLQFAKTLNWPDPNYFLSPPNLTLCLVCDPAKCYSFTLPSVVPLSQEFLP
jgi:hypothetical protein